MGKFFVEDNFCAVEIFIGGKLGEFYWQIYWQFWVESEIGVFMIEIFRFWNFVLILGGHKCQFEAKKSFWSLFCFKVIPSKYLLLCFNCFELLSRFISIHFLLQNLLMALKIHLISRFIFRRFFGSLMFQFFSKISIFLFQTK